MIKLPRILLVAIILSVMFILPLYAADTPAPAGWESIVPLLTTADVEHGQQLAHVCGSCHTFDKDGATKMGPNLYNIVNKPVAQTPGYSYSDAMKALQGKKWTYEALDRFLFNAKDYVPGTKMSFSGVKKTQDRADIIAWLHTLSDKPAPLPKDKKK